MLRFVIGLRAVAGTTWRDSWDVAGCASSGRNKLVSAARYLAASKAR